MRLKAAGFFLFIMVISLYSHSAEMRWYTPVVRFTSDFSPSRLDYLKFRAIHPQAFRHFSGELGVVGRGEVQTMAIDALGFRSRVRGGDNSIEDDYRELPIENKEVELGELRLTFERYNTRGLAGGTIFIRYKNQQPIPLTVKFDTSPGPVRGQTYIAWGGETIAFDHLEFDFVDGSRDLVGITLYKNGQRVGAFGMNGQTRFLPVADPSHKSSGRSQTTGSE